MDVGTELEEFRRFLRSLEVDGHTFEVETMEGIVIRGELNERGLHVVSSNPPLGNSDYDDFNQMITHASPEYRRLFAEDLASKLSNL